MPLATVPPITSVLDNDRELFQQLKIIIPIACTTVVLVLIITVACVVLIRRRNTNPEEPPQEREISKPVDTVPMTVWEKSGRGDTRLSHSREQLYFPAPYATSRISMYSADGDPEGAHHQQQQHHHQHHEQTHNTWRSEEREHTYDVPFMHRQGQPDLNKWRNFLVCAFVFVSYFVTIQNGGTRAFSHCRISSSTKRPMDRKDVKLDTR
ncbi:hypothetical protein CDAR_526431 [Caerostris darwini]|nr:hypothetical protein CDAR_526431 [Caerostris darwini]